MKTKPVVKLIGQDSNIFNLVAVCAKALKESGISETEIKDMLKRVWHSDSYADAINVLSEYVTVR